MHFLRSLGPSARRSRHRRGACSRAARTACLGSLLALLGCGGGGSGAGPADAVQAGTAAPATPATPATPASPAPAAASETSQLRPLSAALNTADAGGNLAAATVRFRMAATTAQGVGARVQVRFNGKLLASGELTHTTWVDYELLVPGAAAGGVFDIVLANASAEDGAALRTLRVEQLNANGGLLKPGDAGTVFDAGAGAAAFDGLGTQAALPLLARNGALRVSIPPAAAASTAPVATAPGVYIDAERGDDRNAGTAASPWRSLAKLQAIELPAGHGVYLRCDSTWRGALQLLPRHIQPGAVISGYGPECATRRATLTGTELFAGGWQRNGSIWSRTLPAGTPKITQLFIDGAPLRTAQWPNAGPTVSRDGGLLPGNASTRSLLLKEGDAAALQQRDLAQATVQLRTQAWLVETRKIAQSLSGQLELDRATTWPVNGGKPYLLQDKLWMLDEAGEYFHDLAAQRLYVIAPAALAGAELDALAVEGTVRENALTVDGVSGVVLRHLALTATGHTGLALTQTASAQVQRIDASHNLVNGLRLVNTATAPGAAPVLVSESSFSGNGSYGIDATASRGTRLVDNLVENTGTGPQHQAGVIAAISNGPGGSTERNRVENAGYIGIHFSSEGNSRVAGNSILNYCLRLSDCGGIYTWTERANAGLAGAALVSGNHVLAPPAVLPMVPRTQHATRVGIYIDDNSNGVTVEGNLVAHAPMGVFVHNATRVTVSNNRIWLPALAGLWVSMDDPQLLEQGPNLFSGNELVPALQVEAVANQLPRFQPAHSVWFWDTRRGTDGLAPDRNLFSGNQVVQLHGHPQEHAWVRGPQGDTMLDEVAWRSLNSAEALVRRPARFDALLPLLGPELVANSGFDNGLGQWLEYRRPGTTGGRTQWTSSRADCRGACVLFTAADSADLLGSQAFSLKAGVPHLYRWSATMPVDARATVGLPYIGRDASPWDIMADEKGFSVLSARQAEAGQTLHYDAYFVPKSSAPARVNLQLETPLATVAFDNVSVREVLAYQTAAPSELHALVVAPAGAPRSVSCADLGWPLDCTATDLAGMAVGFPLTVAAGEARLLLRAGTAFRR